MSSVGEKMTEDVFSLGMGMGGHGYSIPQKGCNPFICGYLNPPSVSNLSPLTTKNRPGG